MIESQREHIEELEHAREILVSQLKRKEKEIEEYILRLKEQETASQRYCEKWKSPWWKHEKSYVITLI